MPPKPRFTREEIVAAALDIVSRKGIEALTARELGEALSSSARPIFTVFRSMEELQQEVRSAAMRRFESYAGRTMPGVPLFKQVGMQMVLFGAQEPKLYQLLFMRENRSAVSFDDVFGGAAGADALHGVSGDDAAGEIRRPVVIGEGGGWTLPGGSCVPPAAERPGRRSGATRFWKISCCFVRSARGHSSSRCAAKRRNICISQTLRRRVEPDSAHSASFLRAEGEERTYGSGCCLRRRCCWCWPGRSGGCWRGGPARPGRGSALSAAVPPRHCTFRAMKNKHFA